MTKKDYIKIADILINSYVDNSISKIEKHSMNGNGLNLDNVDMIIGNIQTELMEVFESDNFRFNADTFRLYIMNGILKRYEKEFEEDIKLYPKETFIEQKLIEISKMHIKEFRA